MKEFDNLLSQSPFFDCVISVPSKCINGGEGTWGRLVTSQSPFSCPPPLGLHGNLHRVLLSNIHHNSVKVSALHVCAMPFACQAVLITVKLER